MKPKKTFWQELQKPFFVLAPLADVTDAAFRRLIAKYSAHTRADGSVGGPDVMWTEFVSADGLVRADEEGREKLKKDLLYSEGERPIVAQLFSSNPENMEKASALCRELGFDGIDINIGCPDRSIEKQGAGAAMMKDPKKAIEVIEATKRGALNLPISVKTRLGYDEDELEEWLPLLLGTDLAAIAIHARTRKEMSKVPARWDRLARAIEIRDEVQDETWRQNNDDKCPTLIIGNGDVTDLTDARNKAEQYGVDGVMFGRAIFGNPWLFAHPDILENVGVGERLRVMVEHTKLFEELLPHKNFAVMKKHYKAYVSGFLGAKELRIKLMETNGAEEAGAVVDEFVHSSSNKLLRSSATLTI